MATYKGIQGYSVQVLASDPSPTASVEGQLWYNSTTSVYKIAVAAAGAWASGTAVNTARRSMASAGTTTAALLAAGIDGPGSSWVEKWNGSTWTEVQNMIKGRQYLKGAGTSTAFIACGGVHTDPVFDLTEIYDGTSWTEVNNMLTARQSMGMASAGTTTASLIFGGALVPTASGVDNCEEYDGTSWSEKNDILTNRYLPSGAGTTTAALCIGGQQAPGAGMTNSESWNGTCWTASTAINNGRNSTSGGGSQTSAILAGGNPNSPGLYTEVWNGSAWTEVADLTNKAAGAGRAGVDNDAALCISGYNGSSNITAVEEWTGSPYSIKTVTVS